MPSRNRNNRPACDCDDCNNLSGIATYSRIIGILRSSHDVAQEHWIAGEMYEHVRDTAVETHELIDSDTSIDERDPLSDRDLGAHIWRNLAFEVKRIAFQVLRSVFADFRLDDNDDNASCVVENFIDSFDTAWERKVESRSHLWGEDSEEEYLGDHCKGRYDNGNDSTSGFERANFSWLRV